ncbi:ABC transporter permease (plasmid) [Embleya sp. NBC_00888]|uniref:ABC transporter permease n=1 Tax=Embleya sp. NBC_00888 TaxID=2975960 RepID=UPI002F914A20|nr:ABC transporter permease [Embleya sp. NBC_00888]
MLRTSLRNLVAYKVRLALTALAVVFGVAFVAAVLVFGDTLKQAMTDAALREHRGISVDVRGTKYAVDHLQIPPLDEPLAARLRALPGTASVTGHVTGFTAVVDRAGALVRKKTSAIGANAVPGPDGKDPRYPLIAGRLPVKAGEAALDERTAKAAGYKVGDRVRIVARGPVLDQTVVGVFTTDSTAVEAGGSLTLLDTATAQELYLEPGVYGELRLNARPGTSQEQLRAAAAPLLPGGAEALTGDRLRQDDRNKVNKEIASLRTLLLVFAGIALFVGSFIIANTFAMLVAQRTRELALLRAIGATRRQVTRSVMFEALAVGVVAGLGGFVIGIGLAIGLRGVLNGVGANLTPGPTVVAGTTALWSLLVGIGVTLLAAWLPVRRAAKIPPVAALRTNLPPSTSSLRRRNIAGALTLALGGAVLLAGIKGSATGNPKVFTVMGGVKGMARSTKDLTVVVPWDRVLIFLVLAAIVGVLAAAWPARRAARLDVLTALRTDWTRRVGRAALPRPRCLGPGDSCPGRAVHAAGARGPYAPTQARSGAARIRPRGGGRARGTAAKAPCR